MRTISIEHFLRTGEFGPIRLGDSYDRVIALFGEPDDFALRRKKNERKIIKYGTFEFYFDPDQDFALVMIFADDLDVLKGGKTIDLDPWILRGHVPLEEVEQALRSARIAFEPDTHQAAELTAIKTQSGVQLAFGLPTSEYFDWPGLQGISLAQKPPDGPRRKQISVSLSMDDYEVIRRESVRTGIKIGQICGEWLAERAKTLPPSETQKPMDDTD